VSIPDQIRLAGAVPRFVPCRFEDGYLPDPAEVERAVTPRTRALVLNSPSNPTGAVIGRRALGALVEIARARDLLLVFDETYERFVYGPEGHPSAAAFHRELEERLIVVNSFSKTYAMPGLRVGFVLGAPDLIRAVTVFQSHTTSNAASVGQKAALAALTGSQEAVGEMLREYRRRRDLTVAALDRIDGVDLVAPEGAFYAFPRIERAMLRRGLSRSADVARLLLEEARVAVVPGSAFGGEGHLRLSFATRGELLEEGLARLRRFLGG
jgi:aspartate aminotransferase